MPLIFGVSGMFNSENPLHEFWSGHDYLHDGLWCPTQTCSLVPLFFAELRVELDRSISN
ncbi:hypothetical protein M6B38_320215 [Iris pallida]|uniref:Uncharacterized protein n=1 Tax=Iris pallida TaxID=29817 RepID=A0AAX6HC48_IRIPA|nr:hypothetical protein M6B38_320215 [Iris pallida]